MHEVKTRDMLLDVAAGKVAQMWKRVASSGITRANANDTIHFLHEEVGEVVKAAMQMGLMGGRQYVRSAEVEARRYTYADLIMEVGDVLLMALTLAQAFSLEPSTCLAQSLRKFYARAAENEGKMADELRRTIPTPAQTRQRDLDERIAVPSWVMTEMLGPPAGEELCTCGHAFGQHVIDGKGNNCTLCPCFHFEGIGS